MTARTVLITVKLGNPNVARAGSGKHVQIASTTCDVVGEEHGYVAASRAAVKFFGCPEDAFTLRCIMPGNECTQRKALFQAEMNIP